MVGRSRTGCLTCRQRKLKCDEQRPVCGQCQKATRECVPSTGIVFRHQQNASMNDGQDADDSLQGFYAYKNTFDKDSVWVDTPKRITFIINADPDLDCDPADPGLLSDPSVSRPSDTPPRPASDPIPDQYSRQRGLEALSAAASGESYSFSKTSSYPTPTQADDASRQASTSDAVRTSGSPRTHSRLSSQPTPSNLSHILNPPVPGVPPGAWEPILSRSADLSRDMDSTTEHEVAFLLRHFSESCGHWMDLFDLESYFSFYVPVKAMTNPLLKNAACSFAAKQLGRVNGRRPILGGCHTTRGASELFPDMKTTDWSLKGSHYYDRAIGSLRDALKEGIVGVGYSTPDEDAQRSNSSLSPDERGTGEKRKNTRDPSDELLAGIEKRKSRRVSSGRALSDEMAAATAILCNYELLEGSGTAWLRHLDGTKTLLDVVQGSMMPLQAPWVVPRPPISRARQATFWNFARQDFLSAFINETQTRLDTEDLKMWRDAGLIIDKNGFIQPSNTSANGLPEAANMKEDMISNALIWIMAKIVNYAVAADTGPGGPGRESWEGINQAALYQTWTELHKHLAIWYAGLPDTFRPCAHLSPNELSTKVRNGAVFPEIWYNIPMCASTMQWYHMSRMLLLLNQPQQSTMGKSTFHRRFGSYKSITTDIEHHGRAICSIAASRPDAASRIHSVQPLFTAGQCLELPEERIEILRLLKEIQDDTGWATDYRVKQLLEVWHWPDSYGS